MTLKMESAAPKNHSKIELSTGFVGSKSSMRASGGIRVSQNIPECILWMTENPDEILVEESYDWY